MSVPVSIANVPDSLQVQTFPKNVEITFRVAYEQYKKVNEKSVLAQVDFDEALDGAAARLPVSLVRLPEYIDQVRCSPQKVEYRIKKQ